MGHIRYFGFCHIHGKMALWGAIVNVLVTPQTLLGKIATRTHKGSRAPTHNLVLLMYVTMIIKGSAKYGYDALMKINHVGKPKTIYTRLGRWGHNI